jgi:DNA-nicking Smr family endonuclease
VFQTLQRPVEAFAAAVQSAQQRLAVLAVPGGRVVPHTAMAGQLLQQLNALVPLMSDGASVAVARQVNQDRPPVTVRVDVHAQRTAQAVNRVTEALMGLHHFQHLGMPITLEIITGRGNNSAGGVAAVRGAVKRHLQQAGIPYSVPPHNSGVVHVAAADMPPGWYPGAPCQVQR